MRPTVPFVVTKESAYLATRMTAHDANVMMAIKGNLAVSFEIFHICQSCL